MDIYTFLVMLHVIGTILGTGGATVAELQITRALKDNRVSSDERALMHANYSMIRAGMAIILVSIIGMFLYFHAQGSSVLFTTEKLWIKDLMFLMIVLNAVALQKRFVPLWLGASISFTSWWGATLLGLAGQLPYSFSTYLIGYVVAIFAVAGLFHLLRHMSAKKNISKRTTVGAFIIVCIALIVFIYYLIQGEQARITIDQLQDEEILAEYRSLRSVSSFEYPGGTHTVAFTFYLDDTGAIRSISGADIDPENQGRIADFVIAVNEELVGVPLEQVQELSRVGGASLTTGAFNESLAEVQAQL